MNPGMRMYMMTNGGEPNRMESGDGKYQERGIGMDEHGYPLPYHEPRPEFGETEARYRGDDGRWKAGTRRNEYNGGAQNRYSGGENRSGGGMRQNSYKRQWEVSVEPKDYQPERRRMDYRSDPYMEDEDDYDDPSGRVIGFQSHFGERDERRKHMEKGMHHMAPMGFDQEMAEEWTEGMENEDDQKPRGPKWDESFLKPLAEKVGIPTDGPKFWEFYAVINSIYSDFCKVFNEYNFKSPMGYAKLAKAWIHDKDAVDNKAKVYYECIVKPKMEEA